ncbi:MAG: GDSL-type esterase/lipase family protein, partial [Mycobacterium sp.]
GESARLRALANTLYPATGLATLATFGRPIGGGSLFRIWIVGDSRGEGYNGGDTAAGHGVQYHLARTLRTRRGDYCYVGTQLYPDYGTAGLNNAIGSVSPGEYSPMDWENEGHSGYTMAQVQSGFAGWLATIATTPDVIVLPLGANTGGHTAAAMYATDLPALLAVVRAACPLTPVIVTTVPPQGASAAVGAAYNALLIAGAAAGTGPFADAQVKFCDVCSDNTLAEQGPDGSVHENQFGYARYAVRLADGIEALLPLRTGPTWPRPIRPRVFAAKQGVQFLSPTDTASGANAGCDIGTDSFAIDFEITPLQAQEARAVGTATFRHILTAGSAYATGITITANGDALEVYLGAGGPKLQDVPGVFGKPGVPVRICVHADRVSGIVSLWVDGTLRSIASGVAAWTFATGNNFILGYNGNIGHDAFPCIVRDVRFHRGAAGLLGYVTGATRLMMESSAADGAPLSGTTAWFKCDGTATGTTIVDAMGGTALTLTGAKFVAAPEPGSFLPYSGSIEIVDSIAPRAIDMIAPGLVGLDLDAALGITLTSAKVSNWQDQGLAAHSFVQGTAGNRPTVTDDGINGRPAVVFTLASTSKLTCADALSTFVQAGQWHCFVVGQYDAFGTNNTPAIYGNQGLINETSSRWGISARSGGGTPNTGAWKVHAGPAYDYTPEVTIAAALPYIWEYSFDGTTMALRMTGGVLGTTLQTSRTTVAASVIDDLTHSMILGTDYSGATCSD